MFCLLTTTATNLHCGRCFKTVVWAIVLEEISYGTSEEILNNWLWSSCNECVVLCVRLASAKQESDCLKQAADDKSNQPERLTQLLTEMRTDRDKVCCRAACDCCSFIDYCKRRVVSWFALGLTFFPLFVEASHVKNFEKSLVAKRKFLFFPSTLKQFIMK